MSVFAVTSCEGLALIWAGTTSKVAPAFCSKSSWIGSWFPVILYSISSTENR